MREIHLGLSVSTTTATAIVTGWRHHVGQLDATPKRTEAQITQALKLLDDVRVQLATSAASYAADSGVRVLVHVAELRTLALVLEALGCELGGL